MSQLFLLSPASCHGARAALLMNPRARFELARRLQTEGVALGEAFTFLSGLYFRGKLEYARAFAAPPAGMPGVVVITPGQGLVPPERAITLQTLRRFASVPIDAQERRYLEPLLDDARALSAGAGEACRFILLGSVATGKYAEPLAAVFGERLVFPPAFVGRGDMSRGGLLLRCVDALSELAYAPLRARQHGPRPPKLAPRRPS